ncbi:hypothetical protein [Vibrio barjaei]|uniref:hypothetical protein n=1 Tax=Vibrio barjaei TaxID=1676683 RepID=UPI002284569F|nr:hypothetical protein [Vibrio barjaei]MCY9874796.1 hypothetical protein [Vibrio barjaei]
MSEAFPQVLTRDLDEAIEIAREYPGKYQDGYCTHVLHCCGIEPSLDGVRLQPAVSDEFLKQYRRYGVNSNGEMTLLDENSDHSPEQMSSLELKVLNMRRYGLETNVIKAVHNEIRYLDLVLSGRFDDDKCREMLYETGSSKSIQATDLVSAVELVKGYLIKRVGIAAKSLDFFMSEISLLAMDRMMEDEF